ncbi:MAG: SDR family NAD(P)-dependent oxidoreductase [Clostridia bacterium]|nr:SDR family NAD(P)-dependent oxidoreductase [Clostridia bacterium]
MRNSVWIKKNTSSLSGKTVAVSGSTGGLGRALCKYLAALGADLILIDRSISRSNALKQELESKFPRLSVRQILLDLEDVASTKRAAEELSELPVDYLVLNAGAYYIPRHECALGYNNVFQINFISPYYLARTLLPSVSARGGRIVAVGSIAHNYSKINETDIDFSSVRAASKVYGNAKRFLIFSLYELTDEGKISVTHPGIAVTGITAHYPKIIYALIKYPMKLIFMSPRRAALSILRGLFEDCGENEWIGPRVLNVWGLPKKQKLRTCSATEAAKIRRIANDIYEKMKEKE